MEISLTEPTSPRYLWINPTTNQLHILMPVVDGVEIGTDNTCKSVFALQEFFGKTADVHQRAVLDELTAYQKALEFDLSLLSDQDALKAQKEERLLQINYYLKALEALLKTNTLNSLSFNLPEYPALLKERMTRKDSNLHSMVLCPRIKDDYLRFVNPVFSVNRKGQGALYRRLSEAYQNIPPPLNAETRFIALILKTPKAKERDFEVLQETLKTLAKSELKTSIDFTLTHDKVPVTKAYLDELLVSDEEHLATTEEYIKMLLALCAPKGLFENLTESPFYTWEDAEALSIITQFFFGITNIYCKTHELSQYDFGKILDNNEALSEEVAALVLSMKNGESIEEALLGFLEQHRKDFGLKKEAFSAIDKATIKEKFIGCYYTIKRPEIAADHFDEFIFLDTEKNGPFVSHQGSICLNFAEFLQSALPKEAPDYFKSISAEFNALKKDTLTHTNPTVHASIELSVEALLERIQNEDQLQAVLDKLPTDQHDEILASPQVKRMQVPKFLLHVARGEQLNAEKLLKENPDTQFLLLQCEPFTDYSGRTFNCTAFEYAYWAKDTHMCRMLINQMDDDTKKEMFTRCEAMEENGLSYLQGGEVINSKHATLEPLITALQNYAKGYDAWYKNENWGAMKEAYMKVGMAQRDVPAHVAHEYCRPDRPFYPLPKFDDITLPRSLTFHNYVTNREETWFPLAASTSSGLGFDFALCRRAARWPLGAAAGVSMGPECIKMDLAGVSHLDEVRSADLTKLRTDLNVAKPGENLGMSC